LAKQEELDSQQDLLELWQEFLEPSKIINTPTPQINSFQSLPVWLEWLNIRNELYELIMSHTKRAFRQESRIGLTHRVVRPTLSRAPTEGNDRSRIIFIIIFVGFVEGV